MISRPDMEIAIADLMRWCKVSMNDDQIRIMHKKLKTIGLDALNYACERFMEDRKQTAAHFPTVREILNVAAEFYMQHPEQVIEEYDLYDDIRYPYRWLLQGYSIMNNVGVKAFKVFAEQMKMPLHDRERVAWKAARANDNETAFEYALEVRKERKAWVKKKTG